MTLKQILPLALLVLTAAAIPASMGCRARYEVVTQEQAYTLTNLHADRRGRIFSYNYTEGALLPMCTPVSIDRVNSRQVRFTNLQTGERLSYTMHRSATTPIEEHVARYFGTGCPDTSALSDEDRSGIQNGLVYQGMSKQGVLLAIGYPPERETPTLEQDAWNYQASRRGRFTVHFSNGLVSAITQ